ncbi:MAG: V-type ATP synthase subunit E [Sphaerochaetaceae bacterium]|nr:V-type ATP synthase subunit E [Sphaerochaetaceae bacterium]
MEQQIQDLVASIRKEGIDEAKKQADELLAQAKKEAGKILEDAKKQSAKIIADAESECALRDQSARAALSQAARDVSLTLKKKIEEQFERILSADVAKAMDASLLAKLVEKAVEADLKDNVFEVSKADADAVAAAVKSQLSSELVKGLVIKANSAVESGIRISSKDGSGYVDLSAEEVASMMKPSLSPALREIIG